MTQPVPTGLTFAYHARTQQGQPISGTIDAPDAAEARKNLSTLQLQVDQLQPARRPLLATPLGAGDFQAFNQQLAQLTSAGLPVEQGLRLMAREMHAGRLRSAVQNVAADLESGKTLQQSIDNHRSQFPPLYSRVIDAGIRCGNLSGVLLNLNRHLAMTRRLQSMLWQVFSYPAFVMIGFVVMYVFIMRTIVPAVTYTYREFHTNTSGPLRLIMAESDAIPTQARIFAVALGVLLILWLILLATESAHKVGQAIALRLPLIGPVLRRNLTARWCDITNLAVEAGLDLPAAIELADDAIASPPLKSDGQAIIAAVTSGQSIASAGPLKILPPMIPAAMELGAARSDLPQTLRTAAQMYEQQAEQRMANIPSILTPLLVLFIGILIGFLLLCIFLPLISMFQIVI